jgi:MFS family permease
MTKLRGDGMPGPQWSAIAVTTVLLCAAAGCIDSFDTQMIGFTGRLIATDLRIPVAQLGWLFGAGQLGGAAGALVFGSLADRFGRRRMLVVSCLLAAACTAAALTAQSYPILLVYRVLTGIGLGGLMPCFLGLGVEAMPPRMRLALTPVLYSTFPLGGVIGAWVSAPLIAASGWRGVFALGAVALAAVGLSAMLLPTSRDASAAAGASGSRAPGRLAALFVGDHGPVTPMLWALFLLAPMGVYLLVLWEPSLLQMQGVTAARTSLLVGFLNLGALVVALCGGKLLERAGALRTLGPLLVIGAVTFALSALLHRDFAALVVVSIVAGAALGGGMSLLVSIAATAYPSDVRATGIGWAMGIARVGQMTAPLPIGWILAAGVSPQAALTACGAPALLALAPLILLDRALVRRRSERIS